MSMILFRRPVAKVVTAAIFLIALGGIGGASPAGVFSGLDGSWRGDGSIRWTSGETERIRCQGTYEVDPSGNRLEQRLTCASDASKLNITSSIVYNPEAGVITGSWNERSHNVGGWVSGNARPMAIDALLQSSDKKFRSTVSVVTRGQQQTVSIVPQGLDVTGVTVALQRSR
jgi:hypothetical protein